MERDYAAEIAEAPERLKFAQSLAQAGLQSMTLTNGGALIALFTVIGAGKLHLDIGMLWAAFLAFSVGIASAQAAFLFGYLSQNEFYKVAAYRAMNYSAELAGSEERRDFLGPHAMGNRWLYCAIAAAVLSLTGFVTGAGISLASVT